MPLHADQIKAIIHSQIEYHSKALTQLSAEVAFLRSQPLQGSRELQRRLRTLESSRAEQQAKLDALQDLQRAIQTLEGTIRD